MSGTIKTHDWYFTPDRQPRGYIDPSALTELWLHTGTACNLSCPFCLEGSKPGDTRLQAMRLEDVQDYMEQACELGVQRFAFTGGEPFVIKDLIKILTYASRLRPCLVLTNGTRPMHQRMEALKPLAQAPHPIQFRVSLDYPKAELHDQGRGEGSFDEALHGIQQLHRQGFEVSIARQMDRDENTVEVDNAYHHLLARHGLPPLHLVAFPDFLPPNSQTDVPEITEHCMTHYQTAESRRAFMCNYTKMLVKIDGQVRIYACTLVDDHPDYDQGSNLRESLQQRVMLKHHRCYSCFAYGASCSG